MLSPRLRNMPLAARPAGPQTVRRLTLHRAHRRALRTVWEAVAAIGVGYLGAITVCEVAATVARAAP